MKAEAWPAIDAVIRQRFKEPSGTHILEEMANYHFDTGGKRIRALIPAAVFSLCGMKGSSMPEFPAAIEILHNATLIHDDLQDGDETRRGKPTIWKSYGPAQAINSGDAFFFLIMSMPKQLNWPPVLNSTFKISWIKLSVARLHMTKIWGSHTLRKTSKFQLPNERVLPRFGL